MCLAPIGKVTCMEKEGGVKEKSTTSFNGMGWDACAMHVIPQTIAAWPFLYSRKHTLRIFLNCDAMVAIDSCIGLTCL